MIDGITIKYSIQNFESWRRSLNMDFGTYIGIDTAQVRTKTRGKITITTYRDKWETFNLIIKEVLNNDNLRQSFYLTIKGSLHKNHFGGANYLPFTWQHLQEQINHLCESLLIEPSQAQISLLEIGVNISPQFAITPFLRGNVISYKGNSFNRYKTDRTGISLGFYCQLSQYVVKLYDKGLQHDLPESLLRYELRFLKMQSLNKRGIKYLSDLQDFSKVNALLTLLLDKWDNVLLYDIPTLQNLTLKPMEVELLTAGQNPKFWERAKETQNGDQFKYQRNKFKNLIEKHGLLSGRKTQELILYEWEYLFKNCPNLPSGQNDLLPELTIKIKGKNREIKIPGPTTDLEFFDIVKKGGSDKSDTTAIIKRTCISCGRDISNQHSRSKFCSSNFVGEAAAHQCRNKDSNPRNSFKRRIDRITGKGVLFDVLPYCLVNNNKKQSDAI